ncbi:MAG: TIGR04283 family arsenosugar biosynthesis glycosyltransferase [Kofleriaceae bacterium]
MIAGTICVFAKPPVPGQAKTRLIPALGSGGAAELARAFLLDTCAPLRCRSDANAVLASTGPLDDTLLSQLAMPCWPQGDGDLGARIERVLQRALIDAPWAIAIGGDSPGRPTTLTDDAIAALHEGVDAVLGPSDDGGFYLLGLRRCPPGLLAGLPWSTPQTAAATLARLESAGLRTRVLAPWFDVDEPTDLERLDRLIANGEIVAPATAGVRRALRVSVVMPVLDEAQRLGAALDHLVALPGVAEVIVVDGGSRDTTEEIARERAVVFHAAPRGRARQQNAGAAEATGDVLLFVHADTTLPVDAISHVRRSLADPAACAGAFRTRHVVDPVGTTGTPWYAAAMRLADVRSRYTGLPYGDQAIFARTTAFRAVGGFPDQPLMEDLELSKRLRRYGRIATVPATVDVSARRFVASPVLMTLAVNVMPLLYRLGVSPDTLATWYRDIR